MAKSEKATLTKLELQIMQVIWRLGASTVSDVQQGLEQELAYTTVQTMLNILEKKGKLKRKLRGRSYEYSAATRYAKQKLPATPFATSLTACSEAPAKSW